LCTKLLNFFEKNWKIAAALGAPPLNPRCGWGLPPRTPRCYSYYLL